MPGAWWEGHGARLLYILRPVLPVCSAIVDSLASVYAQAATHWSWPKECWHQSISDRYRDAPEIRKRMLDAGANVHAAGFELELDRLRIEPDGHAGIRARTRSVLLDDLVIKLRRAVLDAGLPWGHGHWPHITLRYDCTGLQRTMRAVPPVHWHVDAFELVAGGGNPYRYTTLARWSLAAPQHTARQLELFH
jgi:hypothetical protein